MKPGKYLVEAVLPGNDHQAFVEVYRTVVDPSRFVASASLWNKEEGIDPDTCRLSNIIIKSQGDVIKAMVAIPINDALRKSNPLLPATLYVDAQQTTPAEKAKASDASRRWVETTADGTPYFKYGTVIDWVEKIQKRLPTAAEYDAIVAAVERGEARIVATGAPATMQDLFDDFPELSTTVKVIESKAGNGVQKFRDMHVLKGFKTLNTLSELTPWIDESVLAGPDSKSPKVSFRGVRSATPRFVKP